MIKGSSIKLAILGESTTGKTSISNRLLHNTFYERMSNTIGASFMAITRNDIKYEIWDTAGQERFHSIMSMYYRGADIIFLVYDVSQLETVDKLLRYLENIVGTLENEYKIFVLGNKTDLLAPNDDIKRIDRLVREKLDKYEVLVNKIEYLYISTKTGQNYDTLYAKMDEFAPYLKNKKDATTTNKKDIVKIEEFRVTKAPSPTYDLCGC